MPNTIINRRLFSPHRLAQPPISGYHFWYRADGMFPTKTNSYGSVDGAMNISEWSDLGNTTSDVIQSTGALQPVLADYQFGRQKGVSFSGATHFDCVNLTSVQNVSGFTLYAVAQVTTGGANRVLFFNSVGTSATNARFVAFSTGDAWTLAVRRLDADGAGTATGGSSTSAVKIVAFVCDYANGDGFIYENGSLAGSNLAISSSGTTENTTSLAGFVGKNNTGNQMIGKIGDMLSYRSAHTATQVAQITSWLNGFYGIF